MIDSRLRVIPVQQIYEKHVQDFIQANTEAKVEMLNDFSTHKAMLYGLRQKPP